MGKFLLVLLVVALVGAVVWTWRRSNAVSGRAPRLSTIVACAHCGVHIPVTEALMLDRRPYCCAGHRASGPRGPT